MTTADTNTHRSARRDFTGYRVAGAIVALLLAIALILQIVALFSGDSRTVPEVRWGVPKQTVEGSIVDPRASGLSAEVLLNDRARFQAPRQVTGPAPADQGTYKVGDEILLGETAIPDPDALLTRSWSTAGPDTLPLIRDDGQVVGISSLPYANAELFERPFGRDWRLGIADVATHVGAISILGLSFLLAAVLAIFGRIPIRQGRSRSEVQRFTLIERVTHWMTAVSFLMLALTGIVIAFGDTLIRPFGEGVLGALGWLSTWGHMIFFPSFALGIVLMIFLWTGRNIPSRTDLQWFARFPSLFTGSGKHPSARKFNGGQKVIFWTAILGGLAMVATGVILMFPYYFVGLGGMSWSMLIHSIAGLVLIAIFLAHIYIGSIGMEGAIDAMWSGKVDRNWAEEHHDLWLAEMDRKSGNMPSKEGNA